MESQYQQNAGKGSMKDQCIVCGSYAINPHLHNRDNTDLDLCDVHYWMKRAKGVELELLNKKVIENKEKEKLVYHLLSLLDQMSFSIDAEPDSWGETRYNADAHAVHDLYVDDYVEIKTGSKIFPLTKRMKFRFTEKARELLKDGIDK